MQRQMRDVMDQVVAAAGETSGLVDATFDVNAGRLAVHWHDDVPPGVRAVLAEQGSPASTRSGFERPAPSGACAVG